MNRTRTVLFAASIAAAMIVGGVVTASALANSPLSTVYAAASPSPTGGTFKSNENPTHETGESAAQETAENNGTFHPGGPGGGPSNETAAHEASESATREASEKS